MIERIASSRSSPTRRALARSLAILAGTAALLCACPQGGSKSNTDPKPDPNASYRVYYFGGGNDHGSPPSDSVAYKAGENVTIKDSSGMSKISGASFLYWTTEAEGLGPKVNPGQVLIAGDADYWPSGASLCLYARWSDTVVDPQAKSIGKFFWGSWIRMDTGDFWYFASNGLYFSAELTEENRRSVETSSLDGSEFTAVGFTFAKIPGSDNIITAKYYDKSPNSSVPPTVYLFRQAGATSTARLGVNGNVADGSRSLSRSLKSMGSVKVMLKNNRNPGDIKDLETDDDGNLEIPEVTTGDTYTVTVPVQDGVETAVEAKVAPKFDGEDLGFITVGTADENFKVSYILQLQDDVNDYSSYAFSGQAYTLRVLVNNTGSVDMQEANYSISQFNGPNNEIVLSGPYGNKILGTIQAGEAQLLDFAFTAPAIASEDASFIIPVSISSTKSKIEWADKIDLKVYREKTTLYIKSNTAGIKGILISPDKSSTSIQTWGSDSALKLDFPVLAAPYTLALSGAGYDTETKYSVGLGVEPATNGNELTDTNNNEPNDSEAQATALYKGQVKLGFLGVADLDFYSIRASELDTSSSFPTEPDRVLSLSPATSLVPTGGSLTLVAGDATLAASGTSWKWTVDGTVASSTTSRYTFSAVGKKPGDYLVGVSVSYGGKTYSLARKLTVSSGIAPKLSEAFAAWPTSMTIEGSWSLEGGRLRSEPYYSTQVSIPATMTFSLAEAASFLSFAYGGYTRSKNYVALKIDGVDTSLAPMSSATTDSDSSFYGSWAGEVTLAAGEHTIVFSYVKMDGYGSLEDYAWLDDLILY
jgi:hypothetical protein